MREPEEGSFSGKAALFGARYALKINSQCLYARFGGRTAGLFFTLAAPDCAQSVFPMAFSCEPTVVDSVLSSTTVRPGLSIKRMNSIAAASRGRCPPLAGGYFPADFPFAPPVSLVEGFSTGAPSSDGSTRDPIFSLTPLDCFVSSFFETQSVLPAHLFRSHQFLVKLRGWNRR